VTTEQPDTAQQLESLAQQCWQQVANQYGWQPKGEVPFASTTMQQASAEQPLKRIVTNHYCALWYAACCSADQVEQHKAFHALHAYLFRTAVYLAITRYQLTGDYAEQFAADSAQTALITIWQKLGDVRDPGSFLGYAKQIVVRAMLHELKQEGKMEALDREDAAEIEVPTPAVENEAAENETAENEAEEAPMAAHKAIEEAIRRCLRSKEQQQVVIENFLRNKTLQQIADLLGKKSGAIRVLKHRALDRLRQCEEMRKLMKDQNKPDRAATAQGEPAALRYLAQAMREQPDLAITCPIAEQWLPSFVDDELAGTDVVAKYPDIKRHLDLCAACEQVYVELIQLAQAEATAAIPLTMSLPEPDLSFLPPLPSFVTLARTLVSQVAAQVLDALVPKALPDLPALGAIFFQRLELFGGTLPVGRGPAPTLGVELDPADATLLTLSAAYLTTQQIAKAFSRQDLQAQLLQPRLHETIEQTALHVAQENGFSLPAAQTFARIYVAEAQQNPDVWLALITQINESGS